MTVAPSYHNYLPIFYSDGVSVSEEVEEVVVVEEEEGNEDVDIFESSSDEEDHDCECDNCRKDESDEEECYTLCEEKVRIKS